jgi:hypothetical protein
VEGSELDVLQGFTINEWGPRLVIIEAHEKFWNEMVSAKAHAINEYMDGAGYKKIYSDHINNIYVPKNKDDL